MLQIHEIVKKFDGAKVLGPFSMEVPDGKVIGLLGSNGSGKSTLLRLLSGIYEPDGGDILVDGEKPVFENCDYKDKMFLVPDNPFFFWESSIESMADLYRQLYSGWDEVLFEKLCSVFPLDTKASIRTFSKGMKRQAAVILGFASSPRYLFLDEAFDGLDPVMRNVLKKLIAEKVADQNISVVISSHNISEFENMCDVIAMLHKGEKILERSLDTMKYIMKVQIAFEEAVAQEQFSGMEVLHFEIRGRLATLTIKGENGEVAGKLEAMKPLFLETVPLTLEEVFLYEMEGVGYCANILI